MHVRRVLTLAVVAPVVASALAVSPSAAEPSTADRSVVAKAVAWLETQQQENGDFETAGFPGFETPQAVLGLAAAAQSTPSWSGKQALNGALAVATPQGLTALDALDDYAEATGDEQITPGQAAKLVTLVAGPLCLSATDFDPQDDGGVDLAARMVSERRDNGAYAPDSQFSSTLYVALALATLGQPVPADTVAYIKAAQEDDGGWNYLGTPSDQGFDDIDTTSLAVQALIGAGVGTTDADVAQGIAFLLDRQAEDGSWGFGDPNSTAVALLALHAAGRSPHHDADAFLRSQQREDGRIASPNDSFGVNTYATTQTIQGLLERHLPIRPAAESCAGDGYLLFLADGGIVSFGTDIGGEPPPALNAPVVAGAVTATSLGHLRFAADGGVITGGDAAFMGSMGGTTLNSPIVTGAVTRSGRGYYLFAADGGVFTFGDAVFAGSLGDIRLNQPIVAGTATPSGRGYYLFAADGGVFTFGDARFSGSLGDVRLNKPIVGGASTPTGLGYVLFASDGGVFTFGDGEFAGSLGSTPLNQPIVSGSLGPLGEGYALFAGDGGVFTFGDVEFAGSAGGRTLPSPVVSGAID